MKTLLTTILLCILYVQLTNAQWVQMPNGLGKVSVLSLAYSGNNIFAGTKTGIYLSSNNGASWTQTSFSNTLAVYALAVNGNYIYAGTDPYGVYLSTDNGTTWAQTSLNNRTVWSLLVNGNNIYAGTNIYSVYLSTDNGTTWSQTSLNNRSVYALAIKGNNIFAGTDPYGVYLTSNNGTNWSQTSLNNRSVFALAVNGNNIFAGTDPDGVYLSTNNGINWTQTSLSEGTCAFTVAGNKVIAGTYGTGFYLSDNNGTNWAQKNEGFTLPANVFALCTINNYIFAGTSEGVYIRLLSEFLTGNLSKSSDIPDKFSLSQNYPNPFNPTTKIKFALPNSTFAKLVIYDALGREVTTLVNEQLNAGTYEAVWSADKFSSGIYYYRISTSEFSQTKKMLMVK